MTAAIYTRYSSGENRDKTTTTANQVAMCREFAARHGWEVPEGHIYSDEYISGGSDDRPAFQRMLGDIAAGSFPGVLVCKDTSRFARNELQAGIHKDWIRRKGIQIRFVLQDFGDSDEGWFTERQMDLIADFFRRKKSKEVFAHQRQNALQGYSNGGRPPYGYQRKEMEVEGKRKVVWELHLEEAPIVRQVFDWHLQGAGAKEIRRRLTEQGKLDRKGKPFAHSAMLEWFKNPYRYAGFRCWNVRDEHMKRTPKSEWVMVPDAHPAIITTQEADKVYTMSEKRKRGNQIQPKREYLLSGLLRCELCGMGFAAHNHAKKGKVYYRCSQRNRRGAAACENRTHLNAEKIERQVVERVIQDLTNPKIFREWLKSVLEEADEARRQAQPRRERIASQLIEINAKIERLVDAIAEASMPLDVIRPRMMDLRQEKYRLEGDLKSLSRDLPDEAELKAEDLRMYAETLREAIEAPATCREILSVVLKQIRVQASGDCTLVYRARIAVYPQISSATGNRTPV